jgi:hypothetical protein
LTDPFPVPEVTDPRCSHDDALELTDAVHEQEVPAVTTMLMLLEPPWAAMLLLVGEIE